MINKVHPQKNLKYSFISDEGFKENERQRFKNYFLRYNDMGYKSSNGSECNDNNSVFSQKTYNNIGNKNFHITKREEILSTNSKSEQTQHNINSNSNSNFNLNEQQRHSTNNDDDYYNITSDRTFNDEGVNHSSLFNQNKKLNIQNTLKVTPKQTIPNKIKSLFSSENDSNINSNGILTEEPLVNKMNFFDNEQKFIFLKDVEEKIKNLPLLSLEKLLSLTNFGLYNIFLFLSEDIRNILYYTPQIGKKIRDVFDNKFSYIIDNFKNIYGNYLELYNYNIIPKREYNHSFAMVIKFTIRKIKHSIFSKRKNFSYEISYCYKGKHANTSSIEFFTFDVYEDKVYPLWMSLELEEFKNKLKRTLCLPSIQRFSFGDSVIIKINLFNMNESIEDVEWNPIKIIPISTNQPYINGKSISKDFIYDIERSCEIEKIIRVWNKENDYTKNNKTLKRIIKLMERNFKVNKIYYDCVHYAYFKVEMQAERIGVIDNSDFFNCKIEVVEKGCQIENECVSMGYINKLSSKDGIFKIRKNMKLIVYITDVK